MAGRPKKTLADLPEGWKKRVLKMGREGKSDVQIYVALRISESTFKRFLREEREFSSAVKRAREASEAWWLEKGRQGVTDKSINPTMWYMNMKNRFGWRDAPKEEVKTESVEATAARLLATVQAMREVTYGNTNTAMDSDS